MPQLDVAGAAVVNRDVRLLMAVIQQGGHNGLGLSRQEQTVEMEVLQGACSLKGLTMVMLLLPNHSLAALSTCTL